MLERRYYCALDVAKSEFVRSCVVFVLVLVFSSGVAGARQGGAVRGPHLRRPGVGGMYEVLLKYCCMQAHTLLVGERKATKKFTARKGFT